MTFVSVALVLGSNSETNVCVNLYSHFWYRCLVSECNHVDFMVIINTGNLDKAFGMNLLGSIIS